MTLAMDNRSIYLRKLVLRGLKGGGRGHIGSSLSPIEIIRVIYDKFLNFDKNKKSINKFILSKGQGCLALYAILADKKFFDKKELDKYCRPDGILGGHPEKHIPGIEVATGALGHGLSIGVGFALAQKIKQKKGKVFILMGDGEINEGSVWEAALMASKYKLNNLTAIIDYNKIQSAGYVKDILPLEPLKEKWEAFGFNVHNIDGHDIEQIEKCLKKCCNAAIKPNLIIANTIKGKGITSAENNLDMGHKSKIDDQLINKLSSELDSYAKIMH